MCVLRPSLVRIRVGAACWEKARGGEADARHLDAGWGQIDVNGLNAAAVDRAAVELRQMTRNRVNLVMKLAHLSSKLQTSHVARCNGAVERVVQVEGVVGQRRLLGVDREDRTKESKECHKNTDPTKVLHRSQSTAGVSTNSFTAKVVAKRKGKNEPDTTRGAGRYFSAPLRDGKVITLSQLLTQRRTRLTAEISQ